MEIAGIDRVALFEKLGRSFKTTNCIESLNSQVAPRTDKVDYWKNADQKHRWLPTALLDIEPREHLRRYVQGQLSDLPRKSVEPMALGNVTPPRMLQRFLE